MTPPVTDQRQAGQGGFTLIIVLVAVGVFSLIAVALLSLVSTDSSTSTAFADSARTRRAVDGALQTGLTKLKTTTAADLATGGSCASTDGVPVTLEGETVTVRCDPATPTGTDPVLPSPGGGGTVLTVLGNYDIANGTGPLGTFLNNLILLTGGNPNDLPGLIHVGNEPLRIFGDVKVRQWGLGATPSGTFPAVDVAGTYREGDNPRPACGSFFGNTVFPSTEFRFRATADPQCSVGRDAVTPAAGPAVAAQPTGLPAVTLPSCTNGTLVTLRRGAYTNAQTLELNKWFKSGLCDNVTFWFEPGDYSFDATGSIGEANSLVFDDPTSNWVFGAPNGWAPPGTAAAGNFPQACDRTQQGVRITLGPSTALQHRAGRVAICGTRQGGIDQPTIRQAPPVAIASRTWAGAPTSAVGDSADQSVPLAPGAAVLATNGPVPADYPALGSSFPNTEVVQTMATNPGCAANCANGIILNGFSNPAKPAPAGRLTRAVLKLRGNASDVAVGDASVTTIVKLVLSDGRACNVIAYDVPRNHLTTPFVVDLLAPVAPPLNITPQRNKFNACIGANPFDPSDDILVDAKQLEGAKVSVYEYIIRRFCWFCGDYPRAIVRLDFAWLETTTAASVSPPSLPISMAIDPDGGRSFNVFGQVYLPAAQIDVKWSGPAGVTPANEVPIFVGDVVARGLASSTIDPQNHIGVLASRTLVPGGRHVILRAVLDGRLRGIAEVRVTDDDPTHQTSQPGRLLEIVDWTQCNQPETATTC